VVYGLQQILNLPSCSLGSLDCQRAREAYAAMLYY
jgi:hypothetical protein